MSSSTGGGSSTGIQQVSGSSSSSSSAGDASIRFSSTGAPGHSVSSSAHGGGWIDLVPDKEEDESFIQSDAGIGVIVGTGVVVIAGIAAVAYCVTSAPQAAAAVL